MKREGVKVAIVGSRTFSDYELMKQRFLHLTQNIEVVAIVSEGAKGADRLGADLAKEMGLELVEFLPEYDKFKDNPRAAPLARNRTIAYSCDVALCFWDGQSRGTLNFMGHMKKLGKPYKIIRH